jgi:hypothetical protein
MPPPLKMARQFSRPDLLRIVTGPAVQVFYHVVSVVIVPATFILACVMS